MENNSLIIELQTKMSQAVQAYVDWNQRHYERKGELEAQLRKTLEDEFGEEGRKVSKAKFETEEALRKAVGEQRVVEMRAKMPYPEGTIFDRWAYKHSYDRYRSFMGKVRLEIFKDGDAYPRNMRWSIPSVGSMVMREIKKDGTPGLQVFKAYQNNIGTEFLPEGQKPNQK